MLVSIRWLSRHIDLTGLSPEQICEDLTLSTAEVEGLEPFAPHLSDVRVGHVLERNAHPDADKLSVCHVDIGGEDALTIVCGAPNVSSGQKVAVAPIGTVLPGDFKIKKSKIRGVASQGMICSVRELELGEDHDGIWVLDENAEVGASVSQALGLEDFVIEIDNKSLTHRPDLWGHRGIAGELAAIYSRPLKPLNVELPDCGNGAAFPVQIDTSACSRYLALPIDGARAEPSPDWLRFLLLAVGQRPIDQIVDVSNFVMLDLGQPNHTFDRQKISSGVNVRMARDEERLFTLDGEERSLQASDLLICSGDEPIALAGIMGGQNSKVGEDTSALLLEVATFDPVIVRRTSARLALRTDSSARFEKSLDPTLPLKALGHFVQILRSFQPKIQFPGPLTDAGEWVDPAHRLTLRTERVHAALGKALDEQEMEDILRRLGFGVQSSATGFSVDVPSARSTKDITIERDLIEEIGRIHRYHNIPEQALRAEIAPPKPDLRRNMVRQIQDRLAGGARFREALSYSFVADESLERLGLLGEPYVQVVNPAAQGMDKVRRSVLPSLLPGLEANRRLREDIRLFEIGKGYHPEQANDRGEPLECHQVGLVWAGCPPDKSARFDASRFHQLQGVITDLLDHLQVESIQWRPSTAPPAWAHPAKTLEVYVEGQEEPLGLVTELDPGLCSKLGLSDDLRSDVAASELSIDALLGAPKFEGRYRPIPRFPGIKVDVAVALKEETPAAAVEAAIRESGKGLVADIELFDLYRGENLGESRKSLAYHVLLQSASKTLTEKDERKFLKRFEQAITQQGGELRNG
ncbi:MAG: phenylalanine--tRNA ligase subunit beta [bacterium TMED88]|nr:phenylalanine--tRNA ligase subunit beta [Deltaproteobacteria bacterium]OUV35830.1 MAG: phenylalanine--tRNA ligase subunit beta [bacterium TMED88]